MNIVLPETFEPVRRQFRVPGRVLDIAMPEVMLDGSGILAIVGEFVARRMAHACAGGWETQCRRAGVERVSILVANSFLLLVAGVLTVAAQSATV